MRRPNIFLLHFFLKSCPKQLGDEKNRFQSDWSSKLGRIVEQGCLLRFEKVLMFAFCLGGSRLYRQYFDY